MSEELSAALHAFAQDCRGGAGITPSPVGRFPTRESGQQHFDIVNDVCDRLDELAAAALERHVRQAEFIVLQTRLTAESAIPAGATLAAVQTAFARQGPPYS